MNWLQLLLRLLRFRRLPRVPEPPADDSDNPIVAEINRVRAKNGRRALVESECLTEQAREHAVWMANEGNLTHDGWQKRLRACGQGSGSENIAWNYRSPSDVVAGWQSSSGHRANQLGDWTLCGAAEHGGYWVAIFA